MDKLHDSVLLHILSRFDNAADVARCRVAWKAFDAVFPGLRSINLGCRDVNVSCRDLNSFKKLFLTLILKPVTIDSVSLDISDNLCVNDFTGLTDDFIMNWLPRVSGSLKSLSMSYIRFSSSRRKSNILLLISSYCHNLVNLKLKSAWLCMHNLNPLPTITSLTLESTRLEDENLNELNRCFPNLQVLNLVDVFGLKDPKIHLLNLKAFHWDAIINDPLSLTLITPNLIALKIVCFKSVAVHVEAPMLSRFHLKTYALDPVSTFTLKKFENLNTLLLDSYFIGSLLSEFPITKTLETLTLYSQPKEPVDAPDKKLITLAKVFKVFPNVSFLRINSIAWSELEASLHPHDWDILDGRKGLKRICANLKIVDPSLSVSYLARLLDQCVCLSEVSLLTHADVVVTESKSFMSKCMAHWPELKWKWGIWREKMNDS